MKNHHPGIWTYLQSTLSSNINIASKLNQKAALKAVWTFKKIKYIDDPIVAKVAKITVIKNQLLV